MKRSVGIFLYNNVEVLDFAGPFEVFSTASRLCLRDEKDTPFEIFTFSSLSRTIIARGGLKIVTDYLFKDVPHIDILIIPGGIMDEPLRQPEVIQFIQKSKNKVKIIASFCTEAFLLLIPSSKAVSRLGWQLKKKPIHKFIELYCYQ